MKIKSKKLYRRLETKYYLCTKIQNKMGITKLKVVLTEEAQAFLDTEQDTLVIATWHNQENSKNTIKGNCQSRRDKKRVF